MCATRISFRAITLFSPFTTLCSDVRASASQGRAVRMRTNHSQRLVRPCVTAMDNCQIIGKGETTMSCPKKPTVLAISLAIFFCIAPTAQADDVTDWNQHMLRATTVAGTSPLVTTRVAAIVQASVFDAVNGIDRKYAPVHVAPAAPAGASR